MLLLTINVSFAWAGPGHVIDVRATAEALSTDRNGLGYITIVKTAYRFHVMILPPSLACGTFVKSLSY